jgi:type I restriction enzyme S subunit
MKSSKFNSLIRNSTTGTVRQTLGFDSLAEILVPVPSIEEQQKLLDEYHALLSQSIVLNKKADEMFADQLTSIQKHVSSYSKPASVEKQESLLNIIHFTSTDRWEVGYIYKKDVIDAITNSFKFPTKSIGELQKEVLYGLSNKASLNRGADMIPMLRMGNIKNGEFDYEDMKYLPRRDAVTAREPEKWLLQKGDMLINRTNSKELVGKAAIFESDDVVTYASYLIRYRFNTDIVLPEYVNIIFATPLAREQISALSRQVCGQCNINSDEINSIKIPVPTDIQVQRNIIQLFQDSLGKSKKLKEQANDTINNANEYLETAIYK